MPSYPLSSLFSNPPTAPSGFASTQITDSTPAGRSVLTATDAAAIRSILGIAIGTLVGQLVAVQTGGKLPALDASDLTNAKVTAANITDATAIGRNVLQGTDAAAIRSLLGLIIGTAVGNVVTVQAGGKLPALDASNLTNLPAAAIAASGITNDSAVSGANVKLALEALATSLLGKAATIHGHAISDVTGLQTALDAAIGTAKIIDDAVTNAKLANMAAYTFKGNSTNAAADPADMTADQAVSTLAQATAATTGMRSLTNKLNLSYNPVTSGTTSGSVTFDLSTSVQHVVNVAGALTLPTFTNGQVGTPVILNVANASGSTQTLAYTANIAAGGLTLPTSIANGKTIVISGFMQTSTLMRVTGVNTF